MLIFFQDTTLYLCPSPEKLKPFETGNEKSPLLSVQELGGGDLVISSSCSYSERSQCKYVKECTCGYSRGREGGMNWGNSIYIYALPCVKWAFQVTRVVKNSPAKAGRFKRCVSLTPGLGRSLEEVMATNSSILAWRIPLSRGAWRATVLLGLQSQTPLKWLSVHACMCKLASENLLHSTGSSARCSVMT